MPTLTQVERKFILHWGEMGTRWGINRTVAQVHALLYLAPRPLNAEEIAQTLSVARSNVSTSLRELESWRIVKPVHLLGDRREHYETMMDVWEMFRIIVEERKRRELDPTLELLRSCVAAVEATEAATREQQQDFDLLDNYGYVDLDPLGDDQYALDTAGAARVNFRVTCESASATAVRVLPVELVEVAGATPQAA